MAVQSTAGSRRLKSGAGGFNTVKGLAGESLGMCIPCFHKDMSRIVGMYTRLYTYIYMCVCLFICKIHISHTRCPSLCSPGHALSPLLGEGLRA